MRNRKRPIRLFYFFAIEISLCLIISVALLFNTPIPSKPSFLIPSPSSDFIHDQSNQNYSSNRQIHEDKDNDSTNYSFKIKRKNEDTEITHTIRYLIHNSYLSYCSQCLTSDYLQPISGGCLNSSGLSLTMIESLESLYLLGLADDFKISTDYIFNKFSCRSSKFQNFHEMGTRVLGSLIGIYSLTNNFHFIEQAVECADVMNHAFTSSVPHPIIDGIKLKAKKYSFIDGTFLSESSGFIFEYSLLSKITRNQIYSNYVQDYLKCVLSLIKAENSLPISISVDKCRSTQKIKKVNSLFNRSHKNNKKDDFNNKYDELNGYIASFISNIIRVHLISPSNQTIEIIDFISDFLSKANKPQNFDSSFCQLVYLMKKIPKLKSSEFYKDLNNVCQSISNNNLPVQKSDLSSWPNLKVKNDGFYFDFIPLIDSTVSEKNENQLKYLEYLNTTKCKNAQCALISQDPIVYDDLMPSELLSKWLKYLYLANSSVLDFSKDNLIINEAGHLIITDSL